MMARPPPARPHIGINPPTRFSSYSTVMDWGEDDAWDSASDSESPVRKPTTSSKPIPVGRLSGEPSVARANQRPKKQSSATSLAFSYTHVTAPSPSSYSPRPEQSTSPKASWTVVRRSVESIASTSSIRGEELNTSLSQKFSEDLAIEEEELILGDMENEVRPRPGSEYIREDTAEIVLDPLHSIRRQQAERKRSRSPGYKAGSSQIMRELSIRTNRKNKFVDCLLAEDVNIVELRKLAWNGIPDELRPVAWQLLHGYLPLSASTRKEALARKRREYSSLVDLTFQKGREGLDQQIWHQIEIDVPRTRPGIKLWMYGSTQKSLEKILYVWAIRHPASGYVQGINDLVTPFFQVFLSAYITSDPEEFDPELLPSDVLKAIEADSFWCLTRLLDGIQDNYIFAQPGIQRSVKRMAELVHRIDAPLAAHLQSENVEFMQFAFRWMNCLLMREMSVRNTIRMWDTYFAEGPEAFSQFHLYVCSAFLVQWSKKLQEMDFQGIIMFLQSLPTQDWSDHEIALLLGQAFVFSQTWQNASSHFLGAQQ